MTILWSTFKAQHWKVRTVQPVILRVEEEISMEWALEGGQYHDYEREVDFGVVPDEESYCEAQEAASGDAEEG